MSSKKGKPNLSRSAILAELTELRACPKQITLFRRLTKRGFRFTKAWAIKHATRFDWEWAAAHLLLPRNLAAYWAARAEPLAACEAATAEAWAAYEAATAEPLAAYKAARAEVWAAYWAATAEPLAAYQAATAEPLAACEAAIAEPLAAYEAARAEAFATLFIKQRGVQWT